VLELIFLTSLGVNVVLHVVWYRSNFIRHRIVLIVSYNTGHYKRDVIIRVIIVNIWRVSEVSKTLLV